MQNSQGKRTRLNLLLSLAGLALVTAVTIIPTQFNMEASGSGGGLVVRTSVNDDGIVKMYDIREDKTRLDEMESFRNRVGSSASAVADVREAFVRGEENFKSKVPTAKVEYNLDIRTPEVITPDVYRPKVEFLTGRSGAPRVEILRNFAKENNELIGTTPRQIDDLKVAADYTNPDGNISYVHLEQEINGVPVFRGEIKAGFTKNNEIIRVINNLAPGLEYGSLSADFRDPLNAVYKAAEHIRFELRPEDTTRNDAESTDLRVKFGTSDWATTAEKMYFPTEPGVAVPAWRVMLVGKVTGYYVIVDAETGIVLWHKNIGDDQTEAATYNVYANPNAYINVADHAAPLSPYISAPVNDPTVGAQGALITRTNITLIGNEGPTSFNNLGWITDGTNVTDGNMNEAGIDRVGGDGVDAPQPGDSACPGAGCRVFSSTWSPPGPGNPGDDPLTPQAQRGAVIQMFYIMNRWHDELYQRGFTEAARNFQNDNFGRGGVANDRVRSEGQDSSGTNNANFLTPADGGRGRMQMFLWTGPTPDRDGTADADIVIHEVSHGLSNRLHGNSSGLGNMGGQMGEGWGDWYAHTMLAEPTDNVNGIYGLGGYSLFQLSGMTSNYYHGIRRFPTAVIASTGGPNNRPHNPLTFGHINTGCDTTLGTTTTAVSSAFPRNPVVGTSGSCNQVHNAGEIWKSALWEVRSLFVARRGFTNGTQNVLQAVTDGMKLSPLNPTMLQGRDSIALAAQALPAAAPQTAADRLDVLEGFRRRGMGFSATVTSSSVVTEAFDAADLTAGSGTVTSGNNLLEPNECNTLNVPVTNNSGNEATNIVGTLTSNTPGITVTQGVSSYPNVPGGGGPVNNSTPYEVSVDNTVACFTTASFTLTVTFAGGGGGTPVVSNFSLPVGLSGDNYTFTASTGTIPAGGTFIPGSDDDDFVVSVPMPSGWTSSVYDVAVTTLSASTNGQIAVNGPADTAFTNSALPAVAADSNPTNPTLFPLWDDMDMDVADVTGGGIYHNTIGSAPNRQLVIEWRGQHFAETTNGPITVNYAVILFEGSSNIRYVYTLTGNAPNANAASATIGVQRQASPSPRTTQFSFNTASIAPGVQLDGTLPAGQCTPGTGTCSSTPDNPRADFDGDGTTDISVFRPSEGNWYLNQSTDGFVAFNWGLASDKLVPGDYDGDGKADAAVFRADANEAGPDFYILNSNGFTFSGISWGLPDDVAVGGGDYDGDGLDDVAVFRPSTGTWYVRRSSDAGAIIEPFGQDGDIPMSMNHDGDDLHNLAVFRPTENRWYVARNTGVPSQNFDAFDFGADGDILVPADYDGDDRHDVAVFRPSNGTWYIRRSSDDQTIQIPFGQAGDIPVPGDYDGDGTDDGAVYRNGVWYVLGSTSGVQIYNFGLGSDIPIPVRYLPEMGGGGGGSPVTVSYTGPAVAIPDNNTTGVNINIPVSGVGTVSDLNFRFDVDGTCDGTSGDVDCAINHTWVGDLIITLTPPDGSPVVTFVDRPGLPTVGAAGCRNNNFGLILLTDQGGLPSVEDQCQGPNPGTDGALYGTGNFSPNNPLSVLNGENADGTWVLNISDRAGADTGSIRRFSLIFNDSN